jgi:hypothetical protein
MDLQSECLEDKKGSVVDEDLHRNTYFFSKIKLTASVGVLSHLAIQRGQC